MFKLVKSWFKKPESDFQMQQHKFEAKYPMYRELCECISTFVQQDLLIPYVIGSKVGTHVSANGFEYNLIELFRERPRFQSDDIRFQRFNCYYLENLLRTLRSVYLELMHTHKSYFTLKNILFDPRIENSLSESGFNKHEINMIAIIFMPPKLDLILTYQDSVVELNITSEGRPFLNKILPIKFYYT